MVVTPTFATGLGVVIAAMLATSASQAVFSYPPDNGEPCRVSHCGVGTGGGQGSLASGRSHPLPTGRPKGVHPSGGPSATPSPSPGTYPVVFFQVMHDGQGRFTVELSVTPDQRTPARGWRLWVRFRPPVRVSGVWGAQLVRRGAQSVLVQGGGDQWQGEGRGIRVFIFGNGPAGPPVGCVFDGQSCEVEVVSGSPWRGQAARAA